MKGKVGACEVCKCTDMNACADGCAWVTPEHDLCSTCAECMAAIREWMALACSPNLKRLMLAAVNPRFGAPEVNPEEAVVLKSMERGITDEQFQPEVSVVVDLDQLKRVAHSSR